jgi:hypothetical protein
MGDELYVGYSSTKPAIPQAMRELSSGYPELGVVVNSNIVLMRSSSMVGGGMVQRNGIHGLKETSRIGIEIALIEKLGCHFTGELAPPEERHLPRS